MSDELLYKNLIAAFFAGRNLIAEHKHRIDNCFNFVAEKLPPLTVRARETILKTIKSVEITFLKRWRKFSYADLERFQHDNEKWVNTSLKVDLIRSSNKLLTTSFLRQCFLVIF